MIQKKSRQERGVAGTDIIISVIIIVLFASIIIVGMYQAFVISAENQYAATAVSYIIQFLEYTDKADYDSVTVENLENIRDSSQIDSAFSIQFAIENYKDTHAGAKDIIKTVTVTVNYDVVGKTETIEISKLKVKE